MTGSSDLGDPQGDIIRRGRMALDALKSREQAALFHAARVDLQVALSDAESGDDELLQRWLEQYRSVMEQDLDLQSHFASFQAAYELAVTTEDAIGEQTVPALAENWKAKVHAMAGDSSPLVIPAPAEIFADSVDVASPWPAMIEGAHQRAAARLTPGWFSTPIPKIATPIETPSHVDGNSIAVDQLSIPASIQAKLQQDKQPDSKRKLAWFSSSFIGSIVVHLIALIAMSTYMIRLARNPELKAIVASSVETETFSMEEPVEMSSSETPTLDPSATLMPTLPNFAAATSSSSNIQLPASMTGLTVNESSSAAKNAIEQATSSAMSNAAANSVQFFGVKAAGNTFCYVVDGSPSMKKDGAFAAAKAELLRSLSLLKPKQRFYISFFGGEVERLKLEGQTEAHYPVYATPENLRRTLLWIERVRVQERGLPPNNALNEAIKMDPDSIFLLFDGDTKVDVAAYLKKANRSDDLISGGTPLVSIHTIGFYTQEFEPLMKRIASENNGTYRFVPNPNRPR